MTTCVHCLQVFFHECVLTVVIVPGVHTVAYCAHRRKHRNFYMLHYTDACSTCRNEVTVQASARYVSVLL